MGGRVNTGRAVDRGLSVGGSLAVGVGAAVRHGRIVLLVWFVFLALALVAALPVWSWWRDALQHAIDGDRLLGSTGLAVLKELSHYDRTATFGMALAAMGGAALVSLLLNPLIAGGLIGVLLSDARPAGPRFFETGARCYGPLLRALIVAGLLGLFVVGAVSMVFDALGSAAADRGASMMSLLVSVLQLIAIGLLAGFFTAVLDVARIHLVRASSRRAVAAVFGALRVVLRRLPAFAAIGGVFLVALIALAALTLGVSSRLPGDGWPVVLAAVVLQQLFSLGRTALRTAVLGTEMALMPVDVPVPQPAPVEAPEPESPVVVPAPVAAPPPEPL
jgi:hypothetical protein